jgi:hypothetical protein
MDCCERNCRNVIKTLSCLVAEEATLKGSPAARRSSGGKLNPVEPYMCVCMYVCINVQSRLSVVDYYFNVTWRKNTMRSVRIFISWFYRKLIGLLILFWFGLNTFYGYADLSKSRKGALRNAYHIGCLIAQKRSRLSIASDRIPVVG